jgi:hypothetical protein
MAKIIKLKESDLNRLVARVIKEQAATATTAVVQKPVAMTDRVKQLVGFLQNGKYTSSEIQQAQNIIKSPQGTRAPQNSPSVPSQKPQQMGGAQSSGPRKQNQQTQGGVRPTNPKPGVAAAPPTNQSGVLIPSEFGN